MNAQDVRGERTDLMVRIFSATSTLFLDVLAAAVIVLLAVRPGLFGLRQEQEERQEGKAVSFVVARLVKLGTPPDDSSALPHRKVPALATGPKDNIPVSGELNPPPHAAPSKEKAAPFAVDDPKLRKVFDTARAFAEINDNPVVEGLPDGVPEGEVTDPALASAGDKYATKLYRLFKELWVVPTLVPEAERKGLVVKVKLAIGPDLKIHDHDLVKKSGNGAFDASVMEIFGKFEKENMRLPEPPDEIAAMLFESGLVIRFHGKDYGN